MAASSNYKRANHSEKVLNILKVYFERKEMCDIVIIAGIDGVKVPAHRILLSACSLYFLNLFTNELQVEKEVTVASVSGSTLRALIDFCYNGAVEIRKDNVKILLDSAYHLQMNDVHKACQDYFVDNLDASNSLEVAQLAENYSFKDMQRKAEVFTHQHFMEICNSQEFMRLNIEQLCKIIASDDLVVNSEEDVFNSCVSWVKDDRVNREKYFQQLLTLVRLPLLSPQFITEHLRSHALCKTSECKELILDALSWHVNPKTQSSLNTQPRISYISTDRSSSDDVLVAIIRNKNYKLTVQSYNNTANEWTDWKVELPNQWRFVCSVIGDSILIVGEYEDSYKPGTVTSYNFKSKTLTAQKPLNTPRESMGCVVLDGYVYIVGGYDSSENDLNTVERWDSKVQTWTYMASMAVKRRGVGIAVLGKYLYAVGGYSGSHKNSVERYDPSTNEWTSMASMNTARWFPGVAAGNGYLYAVGGQVNFKNCTSTVERFDPIANKWTMICSLGRARHEISCAFLGNRLMVVGAYNYDYDCQSTVEEYDIETNKWTLKKSLSGEAGLTRLVKIPRIHLSH